jgi:MFS family permease
MSLVDADHEVASSTAVADTTPSLWRHRNFLYYWSGQSISMLGSTISFIALPLVGVLTLSLDAFHIGLVATGSKLPTMVLSPFIGPVVDRINRRRLMIIADVTRALLIGSVPLAAVLHVLTIWQLIVVGGGVNLLSSAFNVAYQSFLPNVVASARLGDGNSKLEASSSAAGVSGPGIAGWLVGVGGPAFAVAVDAVSYAVSAILLAKIRVADAGASTVRALRGLRGFWTDTTSGFTLLWRDSVLRSLSISYAALTLFAQVQMAVYLLFLVREIHLSAAVIGLIFTLSGIVGFIGAVLAGPASRRLGSGRLVVLGQAAIVAGGILLAAVTGSRLQASVTMLVGEAFFGVGMAFWGVGSATLNQTRTADDVRGRIIGASSVLAGVMATVAGLVGGGIAAVFGLRVALASGSVGMFFALVLVLRRDVWRSGTRQ